MKNFASIVLLTGALMVTGLITGVFLFQTSFQTTPVAYAQTPQTEGTTIVNDPLYNRVKGFIILLVEQNGEAYYVHPTEKVMYYLGRPLHAFGIMRDQGIGITNANLEKVQMALDLLSGSDIDNDGLPNLFEDSLGSNRLSADTDNDGITDKQEIEQNFSPLSGNRAFSLDAGFPAKHKGKIFLQVQTNGEAWYVYPQNEYRYYLARPRDAFSIMQALGLGITTSDFNALTNTPVAIDGTRTLISGTAIETLTSYDEIITMAEVNGMLAYLAERTGVRRVVYNNTEYGQNDELVFAPYEVDERLAYATINGSSADIHWGSQVIPITDFSKVYYQVGSIFELDRDLAYYVRRTNRWVIIYRGNEIGTAYGELDDKEVMSIPGSFAYKAFDSGKPLIVYAGDEKARGYAAIKKMQNVKGALVFMASDDGDTYFVVHEGIAPKQGNDVVDMVVCNGAPVYIEQDTTDPLKTDYFIVERGVRRDLWDEPGTFGYVEDTLMCVGTSPAYGVRSFQGDTPGEHYIVVGSTKIKNGYDRVGPSVAVGSTAYFATERKGKWYVVEK